ncbi:MAG: site-specific integrase [Chloroflexi bacterium]|nr:site-specific integrase [Chloroflexota bacterium]
MAKRRGNQEGSIYQRKSDGKWCATITMADGKRRVAYCASFDEARRKRSELERQRELGLLVGTDRQTLGEYMADWLASARGRVRPGTFASYSVYVNRHVIPGLGGHPLDKFTPQHVQSFLTAKLGEGLSPKTVRGLHAVLRSALAEAVRWGLLARSPATLVTPPRLTRYEVAAMTPADARALLGAVQDDRLEALYVTALYCGLRQGELLGLRWHAVDFQAATLSIRGTLSRFDGKLRLAPPKTESSRRVIALPGPVAEALRAHKVRQLEERPRAGDAWRDTGFVFTSTVGTPSSRAPSFAAGTSSARASAGLTGAFTTSGTAPRPFGWRAARTSSTCRNFSATAASARRSTCTATSFRRRTASPPSASPGLSPARGSTPLLHFLLHQQAHKPASADAGL